MDHGFWAMSTRAESDREVGQSDSRDKACPSSRKISMTQARMTEALPPVITAKQMHIGIPKMAICFGFFRKESIPANTAICIPDSARA